MTADEFDRQVEIYESIYGRKMMKYFPVFALSLVLFGGRSGRSEQTLLAFNALARSPYLDLDRSEGYIIGIEKYEREDIEAPPSRDQDPADQKRFVKLLTPNDDNQIDEQNGIFIENMNDPKSVLVTHIVSYFPKKDYIYHAYDKNYNDYKEKLKPKGEKAYEKGYEALEDLRDHLQKQIERADKGGRPYSHVLIMSMGWNNDQYDSIYGFNRIIENLRKEAESEGDTKFKPLVIGITWPSVWNKIEDSWLKKKFLHFASYWNKVDDADEVGYSIANWLINRDLPRIRDAMGPEKFPKVVALGHSFGARLLSRAIFSRKHLNPEHLRDLPDTARETVDLYLGLQGAFSARRFVAFDDRGGEGAPYSKYDSHSTKIVLTSSENDKANPVAFWSKNVGGENGLDYMRKKEIFDVFEWSKKPQEEVRQAIQNYATNRKVIVLDVTDIVKDHNDIYNPEVAKLIWFCLKQIDQSSV